MNESAASTIPYVPPGHPVRRFVVGIACIAALLAAVWWSGIGRPRLSVEVIEASATSASILVTNDGPTSVELRAAEFDDPRLDGETVELPDGELRAGAAVALTVRFSSICTPTPPGGYHLPLPPPGGYHLPLRITARTALGLDRRIDVGSIAMVGDLACDVPTDVPGT